jgi:DNA-binding FadR family transcriptional regulator
MTEQLLAALRRRMNHRGRVIASERSLVNELRLSSEVLADAVRRLEEAGLIETLSPLPFLVVKLRSWSGSTPPIDRSKQQNAQESAHALDVPVSSSIAAAANSNGDRGAGEGDGLLEEALQVLGPEADREVFRHILAAHDPSLIHRALKRVQATKQIRVSKPALFRALLRKLSH